MKTRMTPLLGLLLLVGLAWAAPAGAALAGASPTGAGQPSLAQTAAPGIAVQDFEDVATTSPFYNYVHNLFNDGVVGGYACGGPGEPCVPPANLPYFRPGAGVTRGQNAKFTDNGRRVLSGAHAGSGNLYLGVFSALNTDRSSASNAGLYGSGATGVWGDSASAAGVDGYGGFFNNAGGGTGKQYGAYAGSLVGVGLAGISNGATSTQGSTGVLGQSNAAGGAGGVFTATSGFGSIGLVAVGYAGAVLKGHSAAVTQEGDGLDVGGAGGPDYGVYAQQPIGDTNYSFYGKAHIHGTNVASGAYESEVVYDGAAPLALGSVVVLDPANAMGGALGVLPADSQTADAAIGVLTYRLTTATENGVAKPVIDAQATRVQPGDRAYITILGRVAMPLPPGATVGTRLTAGPAGAAALADAAAVSFGRVASRPDVAGRGYVLVNFK